MRRRTRGAPPDWLVVNGPIETNKARVFFVPVAPRPAPAPANVQKKKAKSFSFTAYGHEAVKAALHALFDGKCAYCESFYDATQPVDVEHYRPKARIDAVVVKLTPSYWWLASAWENLLPSCIDCNRIRTYRLSDGTELKYGKGDQFPIADEGGRGRTEGAHVHETPLLLNPCEDDPSVYLRFSDEDDRCTVEPVVHDPNDLRAQRARASIDIYGLNRPALVADRSRALVRIKLALAQLEELAQALDTANGAEASRCERLIRHELDVLATYFDGTDRFSAMARSFIAPVFARLGLALPPE